METTSQNCQLQGVDLQRLVRPLPDYTYETEEGPKCPFCGRQYTADESHYFDESGFTNECDECENTIRVEPQISVSWRTVAVAWANRELFEPTVE